MHHCGHTREVCGDPTKPWFPQLSVCYPTREEQAARARFERLHEKEPWHDGTFTSWSETPDDEHPVHYSHGVTIWVSETDLGLGGDFLSAESGLDGGEEVERRDP